MDRIRTYKNKMIPVLVIITVMSILVAMNLIAANTKSLEEVHDDGNYDEVVVTDDDGNYDEVVVTDEVSPYALLSEDEVETLARLVYLEAGIESFECKVAVASVVINRLKSGQWGDTLDEVIYSDYQFTPSDRIEFTIPYVHEKKFYEKSNEFIGIWDDCYKAVSVVLSNGPSVPEYIYYFRSGRHFNWSSYIEYRTIGNTNFGYLMKDYQGGDRSGL